MIRVFKLTKEQFYPTVAERYLQDLYQRWLEKNFPLVLGLATGGTMEPFYKEFASLCQDPQRLELLGLNKRAIENMLREAVAFGLDEYYEYAAQFEEMRLDEEWNLEEALQDGRISPDSYRHFYHKWWTKPLGLSPSKVQVPTSVTQPWLYSCLIDSAGGLDDQNFGIGGDGHTGFVMPCAQFEEYQRSTHVTVLSDRTRTDNARFFDDDVSRVPTKALTMGLDDFLRRSRRARMFACGKGKAAAVKAMLEGEISSSCPASYLRHHSDLLVFLDEEASSELTETHFFGISEDQSVFE